MKKFWNKGDSRLIAVNLLLAVFVTCVVVYATLKWVDAYTLHNKAVIVPDVRGLLIGEAAPHLSAYGLRYSVIDSVFSKSVKPGAIVELLPSVGSKVKEGRIILVTVNALSSEMASIPGVIDLSFRQAYALLTAAGFESVEIEYIPGAYKDLAAGVELRGRLLEEGEMVQLSAPLILKVSSGAAPFPENIDEGDTTLIDEAQTWF
ncbi:MAG: PASTA domain-containing protein [Tannerellaceae bacterium]|jgi:beta-lactam-binding protein with PASTA domain|nr:PASTA domain-containing protein [Tannerellaceae bacterium]